MKTILTTLLVIPLWGISQSFQLGITVPVDVPIKQQMPYMGTNVGIGTNVAYRFTRSVPLYLELTGNWGMYSSQTLEQTYEFSDGSQTITDVTYKSNMSKYLLGSKYLIGHDYRAIRPFITPQFGFARMRSAIVIMDPEDEDDCVALERKTTQSFMGFVYGSEIGVELDMSHLFKKVKTEATHKFLISANYLAGFKNFEYVNVKHMQDEVHGMHEHENDEDRDITATFINVSSNSLHEHKIAELYRTPFRMWGLKFGYCLNF